MTRDRDADPAQDGLPTVIQSARGRPRERSRAPSELPTVATAPPEGPDAAKRALDAIWQALDKVTVFPKLGAPTADADIRQIVVHFGSSGYIVRYTALPDGDILVARIWHGREARE